MTTHISRYTTKKKARNERIEKERKGQVGEMKGLGSRAHTTDNYYGHTPSPSTLHAKDHGTSNPNEPNKTSDDLGLDPPRLVDVPSTCSGG